MTPPTPRRCHINPPHRLERDERCQPMPTKTLVTSIDKFLDLSALDLAKDGRDGLDGLSTYLTRISMREQPRRVSDRPADAPHIPR